MSKSNKGKVIQMLSPENYIRKKARTLPIYECMINEEWEESKMVQISVARRHTNGNITACFYLVDLMCLGIKDTDYMFNVPIHAYREQIEMIEERMHMVVIDYVLAHNILFAGLEFADDYGFKPNKDFTSITRFMLEEDTDDIELMEIECGLNGQPTYMQGPFDDDAKMKRIIAQLEKTAGPENYTVLWDDEDELFDEDDFEDDFDEEDEFDGMPAGEKKALFFSLSSRLKSLSEEENMRFMRIADSIVDDLIDVDLHNQFYDEYLENLDSVTEEDEIADELLGGKPDNAPISEEIKNRFIEIYDLTTENKKQAAKELKIFAKEANALPGVHFLELLLLQEKESPKYPKLVKEYAQKYPDYSLIRLLWATEQITSTRKIEGIQDNLFRLKTFFPGREAIHPIEKHYFLTLQAFITVVKNDINRIEAFNSVLGDLDLAETDEAMMYTLMSIFKVNYLLSYLKQ